MARAEVLQSEKQVLDGLDFPTPAVGVVETDVAPDVIVHREVAISPAVARVSGLVVEQACMNPDGAGGFSFPEATAFNSSAMLLNQ